jgi:hypothetical protein
MERVICYTSYQLIVGGEFPLKQYECVQVGHHKNISKTIHEWQQNGWRLHTYQAQGSPTMVNHYLLFEKDE